ncbi:MAG: hypothetical protein ABR550_05060 [Wenzhouxiangellaceae bacterium]
MIEIYTYGAGQYGTRQADSYHSRLECTFDFRTRHPLAARRRLELSPPARIHPVQAHLVI